MALYSTSTKEGVDINAVFIKDTNTPEYPAPPFGVGELAWGTDGSEWVYCTASISIAATSVVLVDPHPGSWSVSLIGGATVATAPTGQLVGIVGGSIGSLAVPAPTGTQTGTFFWVQRAGNIPNVKCAASTTKNAQLYSSATVSGQVSSSAGGAGTTYQINGLVISVATGSVAGPNTAIANYPVVGSSA
ncbi:MAG TPA: hypothetical protein VFR24_27400 [Candidatus Angelobacter sp.]|nr:hypothetical protein [Candidatus Angelobacter sp.]